MKKLNKKQDEYYQIEEEKVIENGIYEGYLNHGNVREGSVSIWTEKGMTGEKVDNYFISTTEDKPWKIWVKIFAKVDKVYIIYESKGDTVDADDINELHDSIDKEIERSISEEEKLDVKIGEEIERAKAVEDEINENKADKTYVDAELSKKVDNSRVLTDVPENAKFTDTIYVHPETHSANMIEETDEKQFVSIEEKEKWNNNDSTGFVKSVNNKTGDVILNATDVGAEPAITKKTGFNLDKSDSVTSTSSVVLATSRAVKIAYDKALEAFQSASDGKTLIANAITGKGIPTNNSDTFEKMADNILEIESGLPLPYTTTVSSVYHQRCNLKLGYIFGIKSGTANRSLNVYQLAGTLIKTYEYGSGNTVDNRVVLSPNHYGYVILNASGTYILYVYNKDHTQLYSIHTTEVRIYIGVNEDYSIDWYGNIYNRNGTKLQSLGLSGKNPLYLTDDKIFVKEGVISQIGLFKFIARTIDRYEMQDILY